MCLNCKREYIIQLLQEEDRQDCIFFNPVPQRGLKSNSPPPRKETESKLKPKPTTTTSNTPSNKLTGSTIKTYYNATPKPKYKYKCEECDYATNRRFNFKRHLKTKHGQARHAW